MTYYYKYQKYKNKYLNFNNMIGGTHIWMFENNDGEYEIINPEISELLDSNYKQIINGIEVDFYEKTTMIKGIKKSLDGIVFEIDPIRGITAKGAIEFDIGPLKIIIDGKNTHQINRKTERKRKIIKKELKDVIPSKVQSQSAEVQLFKPPSREEGGTVEASLRPVRPFSSTELIRQPLDSTFKDFLQKNCRDPTLIASSEIKLQELRSRKDLMSKHMEKFYEMGYRLGENKENNHRVYVMIQTEQLLNKSNVTTLQCQAIKNIIRWNEEQLRPSITDVQILVVNSDWSVATLALTKHFGQIFAVLNMANATQFGGGYLIGSFAQEEDMFRKTTVVLSKNEEITRGKYSTKMTKLINADDGLVYISQKPHICFRDTDDKGFPLLHYENWFPFYELRAAARDYNPRHNEGKVILFDPIDCERRIRAQLRTLAIRGIKHVILSAFGCGAFKNPPDEVSKIYREVIDEFPGAFKVIVFAIYDPSSLPTGNFGSFKKTFEGFESKELAIVMDRSLGAATMGVATMGGLKERSFGTVAIDRSLDAATMGGLAALDRLKERSLGADAMGRSSGASAMGRSSDASAMGRSSDADVLYDTLVKAIIDFKSIILIDLKNPRKQKHWAWYIFPTYEIGGGDQRQVYITDEIKERLIGNGDWQEIMVQINRVPRNFFPIIDKYRIRSFVDIMRDIKDFSPELTEFIDKIDSGYFIFS